MPKSTKINERTPEEFQNQQYWFYGIPGSGKSHLASIFAKITRLTHYEGDDFHTEADRELIAARAFTVGHRHAQLSRIFAELDARGESTAIVTHALPDQVSRQLLRDRGVQLVWINTPVSLVKERMAARENHHFTFDMLDEWIPRLWEDPAAEGDAVIYNGKSDDVKSQLEELWRQRPAT